MSNLDSYKMLEAETGRPAVGYPERRP